MRRFVHRLAPVIFTLLSFSGPVLADDPPEKKKVYVRPEDMEAARAAQKKAADARAMLKNRQVREGVQMLDEAVAELERTTGPDSDFSRVNRDVVIAVYTQLKQPDKVKAVEARAAAARKKWTGTGSSSSGGSGGSANANTMSAMAKMMTALEALKSGDVVKSASLLEAAMPELEKSDISKTNYLLAGGILASLYDHSQQFAKGEALRKDIIARMEKSLGPESAEVADQYAGLATHYMMRTDLVKAHAAQKRCVEITRKTSSPSASLVDRLLSLAMFQNGTDDAKGSEASLMEAMTMVKALKPVDPIRIIRVAHAYGSHLDSQLRTADSDQVSEAACEVAKTVNQPAALEEAEPDCIRTALVKRDIKTAGELSGRRFARIEKQYQAMSPAIYANAAHELAQVRWVEGKKDEATALGKKAADAQEKALARLLEASGDAQKRAHLNLISAQAYDLVSMGGNGDGGGPAQVRLAFETILRRKGRSLDASADAARLVRLFDRSEDKALAQRQLDLRRQIAAIGLRGAGGGSLPGMDPATMLPKLEAEHDEIGNKLAAASPLFQVQAKPVTIEAVQASIPDDTAFVEYFYYHLRDTSSPVFAPKQARYVAYVVHKNGDPVAVDLGDVLSISRAIGKLRQALSDKGDVLPYSKQVHDLVVAPIKKHLRLGEPPPPILAQGRIAAHSRRFALSGRRFDDADVKLA